GPARSVRNGATARALVLGGGGLAGAAWQLGLVAGLAERGVDLRDADLLIGTSGGATTAVQLASDVPLARLYAAQQAGTAEPAPPPMRLPDGFDTGAWRAGHDDPAVRARVGAAALAAATGDEAYRLELISARLPDTRWPRREVRLTAVDAASGELAVFGRSDGVPLVAAVAASCAVPTVWPPVTIDGRRYVDGGVRSVTNADLAAGYDRIVVLSGIAEDSNSVYPTPIAAELRQLGTSRVRYVTPDPVSRAAMRPSKMDPATRGPSATAGHRQAGAIATHLRAIW
ncbi:MAG: patatin-like phospholipase family protein, partial [Micromonosporaceae bacterium]